MTIDECLESVPPEIAAEINAIIDAAGTYDADWAVLKAAGERCFGIKDSTDSEQAVFGEHNLIPSYKAEIESLTESLQRATVARLVPNTWLDPLLIGPNAVIGQGPYTEQDIERLLKAIRKRIELGLTPELVKNKIETDPDNVEVEAGIPLEDRCP